MRLRVELNILPLTFYCISVLLMLRYPPMHQVFCLFVCLHISISRWIHCHHLKFGRLHIKSEFSALVGSFRNLELTASYHLNSPKLSKDCCFKKVSKYSFWLSSHLILLTHLSHQSNVDTIVELLLILHKHQDFLLSQEESLF